MTITANSEHSKYSDRKGFVQHRKCIHAF